MKWGVASGKSPDFRKQGEKRIVAFEREATILNFVRFSN